MSEIHPAKKAVLCVNTKKNSKVFSYSFFCFFYRKKSCRLRLSGIVDPHFLLKKKREQARCTRLSFFLRRLRSPAALKKKKFFSLVGVLSKSFFFCMRETKIQGFPVFPTHFF